MFEASVDIKLAPLYGDTAVCFTTSITDYMGMWGEFQTKIEKGPGGQAILTVGDISEADPEERGEFYDYYADGVPIHLDLS